MAAGIFVLHLRPVPFVFSSCLLHSHPLSGLWSVRLPSLFRGSYYWCLGSALIANILSSALVLISAVIVDIFSQSTAPTLFCLKTFCCAACNVFPHFFHEGRCPSSCSFLVRKVSCLSPSLSRSLPSLFSFVAVFSSMSNSSASLFALSLQLLST